MVMVTVMVMGENKERDEYELFYHRPTAVKISP